MQVSQNLIRADSGVCRRAGRGRADPETPDERWDDSIAPVTVSVLIAGPPGVSLSICEAFVYTDQALPIERCPAFRDQPPGSTATYNGKCYIFYNQQPTDFEVRVVTEGGASLN